MFPIERKLQLLEQLTGVHVSKLSYFTELKEKIAEISKRNLQLEILTEIARQINLQTSLDEIIEGVNNELKRVIPFSRVSILTLKNGRLFLDSFSPPDGFCQKGMEILPEWGRILWYAVNHAKPVLWDAEDGIEDRHMMTLGVKVAVINPLVVQSKVLGLFVVSSYDWVEYDKTDLFFLRQLAYQLALSLWNQKLFLEVAQAKKEWEATFKAVRDLIIVVDHDLKILRVNPATLQFYQVPEKKLVGQKCCQLFCSSVKGNCDQCIVRDALKTGETVSTQRQFDDGRIMEFYAFPAFSEHVPAVVITGRDITEKMKMQTQLLQTARLAALGEMAAGVAHELNTPLAVILGNSQLLLRESKCEEKQMRLLKNIKNCAHRCKNIVQGLLAFSRQEQYAFEPLSLNDVVRGALDLVSYHIETSNIELVVNLSRELPLIEGNGQQLEQVVVNLLLNAKEAIEAAKGECRRIEVVTGYDSETDRVFVRVSDTGCGIPPEKLLHIFDPFFTDKGNYRGTGLGLSVSHGIVQSHGGMIEVESEPGKGSVFTVKIPVLRDDEEFS
ncbi:MAG: Signal transduction histidine-protein kinase AtoS [Thermacetogenium phaeum]|uniref:histidine kinase n=1 Tax=Thermacetogenium phaeum TaxID=85874 RepID=A0A124FKG0_9THEO|nr:MAG: Signal transduction histidine-protein kinase AtoS [Thermacetogenium phaeum]